MIENYKNMLEKSDFEHDYWSRTAEDIYKNGHDSNRLMKWLAFYDKSYYENTNYYDLMGSILKILNEYLNGEYYVEVKDHRYKIHPNENIILRKRDTPQSLRTKYQVQNQTQIRKNQKVVETNGILEVKNYRKNKQPLIQKPKFKPPNCPSCKRIDSFEFVKGYLCTYCEYIINKQKHQFDKKNS